MGFPTRTRLASLKELEHQRICYIVKDEKVYFVTCCQNSKPLSL